MRGQRGIIHPVCVVCGQRIFNPTRPSQKYHKQCYRFVSKQYLSNYFKRPDVKAKKILYMTRFKLRMSMNGSGKC